MLMQHHATNIQIVLGAKYLNIYLNLITHKEQNIEYCIKTCRLQICQKFESTSMNAIASDLQ